MSDRRTRATRAAAVVAVGCSVVAASVPAPAFPRPGRTELVSATVDGLPPAASSDWPSISHDGRFVAFHSWAEDLVEGDQNGQASSVTARPGPPSWCPCPPEGRGESSARSSPR